MKKSSIKPFDRLCHDVAAAPAAKTPYWFGPDLIATVDGREHKIPQAWLMGACRNMELADAIRGWHTQVLMGEQYDREHGH